MTPSVYKPMVYRQQQQYTSILDPLSHRSYCAPSWSWAALDKIIDISFVIDSDEYLVTILETHVATLNVDLTGQVTDGLICLCGNLFTIEIGELDVHNGDLKVGKVNFCEWDNDVKLLIHLDDFPQSLPAPLYLLPVRHTSEPDSFFITGLLLGPARGVQGVYSRFGMFESSGGKAQQALTMCEGLFELDRDLYDEQEAGLITVV